MRKLYKPCPKDAVCQMSEYLDCQFIEEDILKFTKVYLFCPLLE